MCRLLNNRFYRLLLCVDGRHLFVKMFFPGFQADDSGLDDLLSYDVASGVLYRGYHIAIFISYPRRQYQLQTPVYLIWGMT